MRTTVPMTGTAQRENGGPDVVVPAMTVERDQVWRSELIEVIKLVQAVLTEGMRENDVARAKRWHATMDAKKSL